MRKINQVSSVHEAKQAFPVKGHYNVAFLKKVS